MQTPETMCFVLFFQCELKYSVGVVLVLPGEGSSLGRLGVEVQTKATPRPEAGAILPTQYYRDIVLLAHVYIFSLGPGVMFARFLDVDI